MKIAHLAPATIRFPSRGDQGRWHLVSSLIRAQIRAGHEVTIFSGRNSRFSGAFLESVPPVWKMQDDTPRNKHVWSKYGTMLLLARAYQMADKFDIMHSHLNERHLFFAPFVKTPTVVTQHWPLDKRVLALYKEIRPGNVWTVPISNAQKKQGKGGVKYTKTVYNGINIKKFKFDPDPKKYFVFLGRLHPQKGCHLAIQAALKLNVRLIIAGATYKANPVYREYWEKKINPYLGRPNIKYIGEIEHGEVNDLLKDARALIFPIQWEEPFGLVMVEAMASGTPVISYRKGSVPEIVKNGRTGFVITKASQLVPAMKKIDRIDRAQCRAWAENNFSLEKMVAGYEQVYKNVLRRKK